MYRSFYGLNALPFKIDTDPTFLWLGEKHREAISMLKYGIQGEGHTGILLLTGDVGTGKTTLINALFNNLDKRVIRVAITNPNLDGLDFLNYIAAAYGSKRQFTSKSQFLIHFTRYLKNAHAKGRKVLLVVDEAQLLSQNLLEEIRLFSNIEQNGRSLIHTFLVGQSEFRNNLSQPANRALNQRISLNYHIDALVFEETQEYVTYRLQVAGAKEKIFNPDALALVHRFSSGLPRMINIICDHALLTAYVQNARTISAPIIQECIREVSIPIAHYSGDHEPYYPGAPHQMAPPIPRQVQPPQNPPDYNVPGDTSPTALPEPPLDIEASTRSKPILIVLAVLVFIAAALAAYIFFF